MNQIHGIFQRNVLEQCHLKSFLIALHSGNWHLMKSGASIITKHWPANGNQRIKGKIILLNSDDLNLIKLASQTLRTGHYWCAWWACNLSEHKVLIPFKLQILRKVLRKIDASKWRFGTIFISMAIFKVCTEDYFGLKSGVYHKRQSQKWQNCTMQLQKYRFTTPNTFLLGVLYFLKSHSTIIPRNARN